MAVTQISRIQIRRGPKDNLPEQLAEGEFGLTTDTGELFVGAPNLPSLDYRAGTVFPYKNIKILTEFDVVHTMHDHIVTTGPLLRVTHPARGPNTVNTYTFKYTGPVLPLDSFGNAVQRIVSLTASDPNTGDLRGRVISKITFIRASDNAHVVVSNDSVTIRHTPGALTPNSNAIFGLDDANVKTITNADSVEVEFLNLSTMVEFNYTDSDSFVMDYSMLSDEEVNGVRIKRVGTLKIVADEYSVGILDEGVDINQDPGTNYMRLVFSGHIKNGIITISCTNLSHYPVSVTFCGARWKHLEE